MQHHFAIALIIITQIAVEWSVATNVTPVSTNKPQYAGNDLHATLPHILLGSSQISDCNTHNKCKFPFIYKGVTYNQCTDRDANDPWCKFPFIYKGVSYNKCTHKDEPYAADPWCSIETDENNNYIEGKWSSCNKDCPRADNEGVKPAQLLPIEIIRDDEVVEPTQFLPKEINKDNEVVGPTQFLPKEINKDNEVVGPTKFLAKEVNKDNEEVKPVQLLPKEIIRDNEEAKPAQLLPKEIIRDNEEVKPAQLLPKEIIRDNEEVKPAQLLPKEIIRSHCNDTESKAFCSRELKNCPFGFIKKRCMKTCGAC